MKSVSIGGLYCLLALFIAGCDKLNSDADGTSAAPAAPHPVAVTSLAVKPEDIPLHYEYVGQVAGSLEVDVRSRVTGIIEKRHFSEGSEVEQGQLLFTLDSAPFEARYKQSQAALESARAQKQTAQAQLNQAQRELKRVTPLANKNMLSQNQRDDAVSAVEVAEAQLAVAQAAIKQAEANLLSAKIDLDYTRIRASISGVIGRAQQNRGALVQTGVNDLLTTLVQIDPVHVNFGIPENERLKLRHAMNEGSIKLSGDDYVVVLVDEQGHPTDASGKLDFEDYKVDESTGNFAMRAIMDNPDRQLSPGQFVRVQLRGLDKVNSIAIPQRAVLDGPSGKYVYVVTPSDQGGSIAMQKSITLGEWVDLDHGRDNYWIVQSGLNSGDEVIVDGVARIFFPGMPVQVSNEAPEDKAKTPAH
jgi:membrane fusion protein (multidrug efflux system)